MPKQAPKKGAICYCPMCCQFGKPAPRVPVEGKTKRLGVPIMLCSICGKVPRAKETKYLPGQGTLYTLD